MAIFQSLVKKEFLHIIRDKRTVTITLLMPVVLLLLFGFAISTEVNNVRVVAVVDRHTDSVRDFLMRLQENDYFSFQGLATPEEAYSMLRTGHSDAAVFLKYDNGTVRYQTVVDASNTNTARIITGYIEGIASGTKVRQPSLTYTLFNPQLKSAYNFVPGILGMIFILICAIMTSVSIVREKETGTMTLLIVSPARPFVIILGKLVPYLILSCIILAIMLLMSYTVLGLPFSPNITTVILLSLLYIILSLSIGLLVSAVVNTQLTALIVSAVLFMLPVIMLSGMIFPVDNMPVVLQGISTIIPARWYIEAMRKLMVQQLGAADIVLETGVLLSMTVVLLLCATKKFKSFAG